MKEGGEEGAPTGGVSALPLLPVNDQFTLNKDEAWYTLSIETQVNRIQLYTYMHVHVHYLSIIICIFHVLFYDMLFTTCTCISCNYMYH